MQLNRTTFQEILQEMNPCIRTPLTKICHNDFDGTSNSFQQKKPSQSLHLLLQVAVSIRKCGISILQALQQFQQHGSFPCFLQGVH